MRTHITPVQLFFLVFAYLLSGFFLFNIHSYYAVAAQFAVFSVFAVMASGALSRRSTGLSDFVSFYVPGAAGTVLTGAFLDLSVFQTVRTTVFYGESIARYCTFLPWWMIFSVLLLCAFLAVKRGMTAVGRFSELLPFLLVPLLFVRPFGDFAPTLSLSDFPVSGVLSCVSCVPVFFLASKTLVSGDEGVSDAMQSANPPPVRRAAFLLQVMLAAAASASLLYGFLTMFTFRAGDVFLSLFLWMLHIIRLSILVGIAVDSVSQASGTGVRTAYTAVLAVSVFAVLAASQSMDPVLRGRLGTAVLAADLLLPAACGVVFAVRRRGSRRGEKQKKKSSA